MSSPFLQLLLRWMILALGVVLATKLVPGIECKDGETLITVVLLLSFCNAILKPLLVLFTLPFIIVTLGLGVVVINALLFLFVGEIVKGFVVDGFWSAVWGALIVSITNLVVSSLVKGSAKSPPKKNGGEPPSRKRDDVIDI